MAVRVGVWGQLVVAPSLFAKPRSGEALVCNLSSATIFPEQSFTSATLLSLIHLA